jgi:hypothetical protein
VPTLSDLAGTWNGLIDGGSAGFGLRWTATPSDSILTGDVVLGDIAVIDKGGVKDNPNGNPTGTMTGTLTGSGNQITVTMDFPAGVHPPDAKGPNVYVGGAFTSEGAPTCSMHGTATGNVSGNVMSGNVTVTWSGACGGIGIINGISAGKFSATKQ